MADDSNMHEHCMHMKVQTMMIIRTQFVRHTAHIITTNDDSSVSGRIQWRGFAKLTSCHLTKTMYEGYCVTYVAMVSYWSTYNDSYTAACDILLVAVTQLMSFT